MGQSAQDIMLVDAIMEQKSLLAKHDVLLEDFRELGALVIESFPPTVFRTEALRALVVSSMLAYNAIWHSYGLVSAISGTDDRSKVLEDLVSQLSPRFWDDPTDDFEKTTVGELALKTALLASKMGSRMFVPESNAQSRFAIPGYFGPLIKEERLDALRNLTVFDKYTNLLIRMHIKDTGHSLS